MDTSYRGLKIRFFLAVIILMAFIVLDKKELEFFSVDSNRIYESLCENVNVFDFTEDFPYTLND